MSDLRTPPADHSIKVAHLVLALLFLGLVGIWVMARAGLLTAERLTILAPSVLIAAGVIGLVASLASSGRRRTGVSSRSEDVLTAEPRPEDPSWETPENGDSDGTEPPREIR